jgi:glycosyltransferase involved in cell wall biosynthesis
MSVAFTAVIPTYNRADLIAETLDAVLAQTFPPREILVIDDGSTDDTQAVLATYAGKITVRLIKNSGVQIARNTGIALAKCDWVALCDSDDLWLPTYLEKQAALLFAEPGIGMSFGNFRTLRNGAVEPKTKFDDAPHGFWDTARDIPQGWIFDRSIAGKSFRFHPFFPSAMVFSKELATSVGGFSPVVPTRVEDGEFTLRCLYRSKVAAVREPLVLIRRHDSNASRDLVPRLMDEVAALQYIKAQHAEAAPYHSIIEDEIAIRTVMAVNGAFANKDHTLMVQLFEELPQHERSLKLRVKRAIAGMPDFLGKPLNGAMQILMGRRGAQDQLVR